MVVMSATLDVELFRNFFDTGGDRGGKGTVGSKAQGGGGEGEKGTESPVAVVRVEGRQFPVEVFFCGEPQEDVIDAAFLAVLQVRGPPIHLKSMVVARQLTRYADIDVDEEPIDQFSVQSNPAPMVDSLIRVPCPSIYTWLLMTRPLTNKQIHEAEPLPGDILVFLAGQEDIEALTQLLEEEQQAIVARAAAAAAAKRRKGVEDGDGGEAEDDGGGE